MAVSQCDGGFTCGGGGFRSDLCCSNGSSEVVVTVSKVLFDNGVRSHWWRFFTCGGGGFKSNLYCSNGFSEVATVSKLLFDNGVRSRRGDFAM